MDKREQDRYGDLLQRTRQKHEQEQRNILNTADNILSSAKSAKERNEDKLYRDGLVRRAKKRLDKGVVG